MADGGANPLSYLLGVHEGRNTPIQKEIDPETEAKLRRMYVQMLVELEKADTGMKNATVSTFGNIANAQASAWANFAAAIAEAQKAGAMTKQAQADALQRIQRNFELGAEMRAYEPPVEQAQQLETWARQAYNTGTASSSMTPQMLKERLSAVPGGAPDGQYAAISGLLDQSFGQFFVNNTAALDHVQAGSPQRLGLADAGDRKLREVASQVLTQKLQAAGYDTGSVPAIVDRYVQERGFLSKLPPEEVQAATLLAQRADQEYQDYKRYWMNQSAGMDPEVRRKTIASLDTLGAVIGGGLQGFGQVLASTPSTPGVEQARAIIAKGMASLEGKPDPLKKAVDEMWNSVPGFDQWAQAKGFTEKKEGREKAAIYASRNPGELIDWVKATRTDSTLLVDPTAAMAVVNPSKVATTLSPEEQALAADFGEGPAPRGARRSAGGKPGRVAGQAMDEAAGADLPERDDWLEGDAPMPKPPEGSIRIEDGADEETDWSKPLPKPSEQGRELIFDDETGAVTVGSNTYAVGTPEWHAAMAGARRGAEPKAKQQAAVGAAAPTGAQPRTAAVVPDWTKKRRVNPNLNGTA